MRILSIHLLLTVVIASLAFMGCKIDSVPSAQKPTDTPEAKLVSVNEISKKPLSFVETFPYFDTIGVE